MVEIMLKCVGVFYFLMSFKKWENLVKFFVISISVVLIFGGDEG